MLHPRAAWSIGRRMQAAAARAAADAGRLLKRPTCIGAQPRHTCTLHGSAISRCPPHAACRLTSPLDHSPRLKPEDSWADHRSPSELGASYTVMSWPAATSTRVDSRRPCGRGRVSHTWSVVVRWSGAPDGARRFLPVGAPRGLRATVFDKSRPRAATLAIQSCPRQWEGEPLSRWQGRYPPFAPRGLRVSPSTCLMLQWKLRYAGVTSALEGPNVSSTTRQSGAIHATEYATRHARCRAGGNDAGQGHLTSANGGDHD